MSDDDQVRALRLLAEKLRALAAQADLAATSRASMLSLEKLRAALAAAEAAEFWDHPDVTEADVVAEGWYGDRTEEQT